MAQASPYQYTWVDDVLCGYYSKLNQATATLAKCESNLGDFVRSRSGGSENWQTLLCILWEWMDWHENVEICKLNRRHMYMLYRLLYSWPQDQHHTIHRSTLSSPPPLVIVVIIIESVLCEENSAAVRENQSMTWISEIKSIFEISPQQLLIDLYYYHYSQRWSLVIFMTHCDRNRSIDLTHLMTQIRVINKSELISYARSVSAAVAVVHCDCHCDWYGNLHNNAACRQVIR